MKAIERMMVVAMLVTDAVGAQSTLGALLDAGGKPMPATQFKNEVVQRIVTGPTSAGAQVELMYAADGRILGEGTLRVATTSPPAAIRGEWKADHLDRICASMKYYSRTAEAGVDLPYRCQYWFKLGDRYFLADSDTDRSAKVLSRTIKQ